MCEQAQLTRLIASVYDAALDAELWPGVLADVVDYVGGCAGGLLTKDSAKQINLHWQAGVDPEYMRLYSSTYSKMGPLATAVVGEVEQIVSIPELIPYDEFCDGRFYREWARPQGWVDVAVAVLDKSASGGTFLSVSCDGASGMVDHAMRRRMALVVPHVRRAALVAKAIDLRQARAAAFADVLDELSSGLFLVDANARIVHVNSAGSDMLNDGDFLRSIGGRLVAGEAGVDHILRETAAAAATGDIEVGVSGIAVPLSAHDGERYVAHVLPLSSGARRRVGAACMASAAMFVRKAALEFSSAPDVIGKSYDLTPTELRVLRAIVEIGGVPEVSEALGIAESTVKTHLSRLFEKTGAGRQADLVKLVAGFSTPLAS